VIYHINSLPVQHLTIGAELQYICDTFMGVQKINFTAFATNKAFIEQSGYAARRKRRS